MFKEMNIKKVSLWLFIIMVLSFTIAATIYFQSGGYDKNVTQHNIDDSKNFIINEISEIQLSSVSADIKIIPVDTNEVTAHLYGTSSSTKTNRYPKLTGIIENNKLVIKVEEPTYISIGLNFRFNKTLKLEVGIPKAYVKDLKINTTSANTYINNFTFDNFQNHTVSGNLIAEALNTKSSTLSSVSGDSKINGFTGNLKTQSVSGDLNVIYISYDDNINVGTTSGDTSITLPQDAQFYLDFSSVSGDSDCSFPIASEENNSRRGLKGTVGSSKNEIKVSSVSGDLNIDK
jgi:lia operon protein LiaG